MFRTATRDSDPSTSSKLEEVSTEDLTNSNKIGVFDVDNSKTVLTKIGSLYFDKLMNDVTLIVGGVEYPTHKLILSASSDVFQVMLMSPGWTESQESKIILQETSECAKIFGDFLQYFYTGKIIISHNVVLSVLSLADKYNVQDLTSLCTEYMKRHIALAAGNNLLVSWHQYTLNCGHHGVEQECYNFTKWNFEIIAEASDFGNIEPDVLIHYLQQNDLVIHNEMSLYNCVVRWLERQKVTTNPPSQARERNNVEEQLVTEVMTFIRFPMMSPRQLADLLLAPLTKMYKEFFVDRMAIGMAFHSDQADRVREVRSKENGRLLFTPRLYTDDQWSTLLTVEPFSHLSPYHTRTLVFSCRSSLAEYAQDHAYEWVVDVYPRGVWFKKFSLIVWQGTVEVPEVVLRTVRLSLTCRDPPSIGHARMRVGVLVHALVDGFQHIIKVCEKSHQFTDKDKVLNLDELISFEELNPPASVNDNSNNIPDQCQYLVGSQRDALKLHIVVAPLEDLPPSHCGRSKRSPTML